MIHYHRWFSPTLLGAGLVVALWLAGGCATVDSLHRQTKRDPVFIPKNFTGVPRLPATLRRVVLLPVAGAAGVSIDALTSFDAVTAAELQRTARFEVVTVDGLRGEAEGTDLLFEVAQVGDVFGGAEALEAV